MESVLGGFFFFPGRYLQIFVKGIAYYSSIANPFKELHSKGQGIVIIRDAKSIFNLRGSF